MTRVFVALSLPRHLRDRLSLLRANLPGARWVDAEDYHLTLRFIGDCDVRTLEQLIAELDQIEHEPFELKPHGLGTFGHEKPRAIWIGTDGNSSLVQLRNQIDTAVRRAGIPPDGRKFTPHITLARLPRCKPSSVAQALEGIGNPELDPFLVGSFALYSSGKSRGGGPYALEATFPLHANDT